MIELGLHWANAGHPGWGAAQLTLLPQTVDSFAFAG